MHLEPWQWVVAVIGAVAVGVSKTGIGGLGVLAVALFAWAMPSRQSVGVLLPILISADIVAVAVYRRHAVWTHLVRLFPWSATGIVLGCLAMKHIDNKQVSGLIGAILLILVIVHLARSRAAKKQPQEDLPIGKPTFRDMLPGICVGILAGFTTMVANAAGPIMILYLLAARLPKMEFVGTAAWYFLVVNVFKVPFSMGIGLINLPSLSVDLILAPVAILGAFGGRMLIRHINQSLFENIALALTFVASIKLLLSSLPA